MLYQKIKEDQLKAQKGRDVRLVAILRLLISELEYKAIDSGGELSDEVVVQTLQREAKKREEALAIYERVNETARAEQEKYELEEIKKYLPALMGEAEVAAEVDRVAAETGKRGGQLIGSVMGKLAGKADGGLVARLVKEKYA